jgi:hypothetical protein
MKWAWRISDARRAAPLPLKLIFQRENRTLLGVHCIGDIASEIVGIGQMVIRCGGTLHTELRDRLLPVSLGSTIETRDLIVRITNVEFARSEQQAGGDGPCVTRQPKTGDLAKVLDDPRCANPQRHTS